jgi:ABC-type branched-subunit amino acid transport system ATPase component
VLCTALTVRDNVSLGLEARICGGNAFRQLAVSGKTRRRIVAETDGALELCDITGIAEREAGTLTLGQRRLVELARVCAGGYRLVLLDEPSSGLDEAETAAFGGILRQVVQEAGVGFLLVEHDMQFVMELCRYIYVLDYGDALFDGTPAEVRASELVRRAYLGDSDVVGQVTAGRAETPEGGRS